MVHGKTANSKANYKIIHYLLLNFQLKLFGCCLKGLVTSSYTHLPLSVITNHKGFLTIFFSFSSSFFFFFLISNFRFRHVLDEDS